MTESRERDGAAASGGTPAAPAATSPAQSIFPPKFKQQQKQPYSTPLKPAGTESAPPKPEVASTSVLKPHGKETVAETSLIRPRNAGGRFAKKETKE